MSLVVLSGAVSTMRRVSRSARHYTAAHKNGMEILIKFRDDSQSPKAVPRQAASLFVLEFRSSDVRRARRRDFNPSLRNTHSECPKGKDVPVVWRIHPLANHARSPAQSRHWPSCALVYTRICPGNSFNLLCRLARALVPVAASCLCSSLPAHCGPNSPALRLLASRPRLAVGRSRAKLPHCPPGRVQSCHRSREFRDASGLRAHRLARQPTLGSRY